MIGICNHTKHCSAYKKGNCTGSDTDCRIEGSDEAEFISEIDPDHFGG